MKPILKCTVCSPAVSGVLLCGEVPEHRGTLGRKQTPQGAWGLSKGLPMPPQWCWYDACNEPRLLFAAGWGFEGVCLTWSISFSCCEGRAPFACPRCGPALLLVSSPPPLTTSPRPCFRAA